METCSSASEDWLPDQDETKCGGAFGTFDTYEWMGIVSNGSQACDNSGRTHVALGCLPFARVVNFLQTYKECLPSLQTMHRSSMLAVYECLCVTLFQPWVFNVCGLTRKQHFQMLVPLIQGIPTEHYSAEHCWSPGCAFATQTSLRGPI